MTVFSGSVPFLPHSLRRLLLPLQVSGSAGSRFAGRQFSTRIELKDLSTGGYVAHLWFKGSKKYPILDPLAIERTQNELKTLGVANGLRALFLRSAFAGADINHMKNLTTATQAESFIRSLDSLCARIQCFPAPVIAVINGPCMGAGMELAASCDVRIAVDQPKTIFAMPETKIGIPSVIQASLLPGLMGWTRARELLYFGNTISAKQAMSSGFLNEVTTEQALPEVLAKWEAMIDETEAHAVAMQKALMQTWQDVNTGRAGIEASVPVFGQSFKSGIPQQRMTDFADRLEAKKKQRST